MATTEFGAASNAWLTAAPNAFKALKKAYQLDREWTFSIDGLEHHAADLDPDRIDGRQGAAAFMLRRMQATTFLLRSPDPNRSGLLLAYSSDLLAYLVLLIDTEGMRLGNEEPHIRALAIATADLLTHATLNAPLS